MTVENADTKNALRKLNKALAKLETQAQREVERLTTFFKNRTIRRDEWLSAHSIIEARFTFSVTGADSIILSIPIDKLAHPEASGCSALLKLLAEAFNDDLVQLAEFASGEGLTVVAEVITSSQRKLDL